MGSLLLVLLCLWTFVLKIDAWMIHSRFPITKSSMKRTIGWKRLNQAENEAEIKLESTSHQHAQQVEQPKLNTESLHESTNGTVTPSNTTEIDPQKEAIAKLEKELTNELESLEQILSSKRISLNQARNRLMESGPRGYYLIQAQVNEFLRNKATDEQKLVEKNRKEFVMKLLPLIDSFRQVPTDFPAETEEEKKIHQNYKVILLGLELAVKKFGYSEILPEAGEKLKSHIHQVVGLEEAETAGTIVRCEKSGWYHTATNEIIRKAAVIATTVKTPPPQPSTASESTVEESKSEQNAANSNLSETKTEENNEKTQN